MNELIEYLQAEPGPFQIGLLTKHEELDDYTAGFFCATFDAYELSEDGDAIYFTRNNETEIMLPLETLTYIGEDNGEIAFYNDNLHVNVEGFIPQTIVYIKRKR